MKNLRLPLLALSFVVLLMVSSAFADNPLIMDQFTADPTARVFEDIIYVYPSHDIPAAPGRGRSGWFVMEDYHTFSSENLLDWTDHGVILSQTTVPWVSNNAYSMWAPDCVYKDGKYYFYFPAQNRIGVATADKPSGPFTPEPNAMQGANGIDPCVLIDKDGSAYLYYSMNQIFVAKLADNMLELEGRAQSIRNLTTGGGLVEGPFAFERNGIYYLTYPHAIRINNHEAERLEYATGESPTGPFTPKGVIMDQSPSGCWTNHHSLVEYKDQWYLFYHDQDLSPDFDKNRSIHADYLTFNEDGTIQKVIPTLRGVGIADAKRKIQIDRYSAISEEGAKVSFLNPDNTFEGWKTALNKDAWIQYNRVDFGDSGLKSVKVQAVSSSGGSVEIRLDKADGEVLATVEIPEGTDWKESAADLDSVPSGQHDLVVTLAEGDGVEIDWVSFE